MGGMRVPPPARSSLRGRTRALAVAGALAVTLAPAGTAAAGGFGTPHPATALASRSTSFGTTQHSVSSHWGVQRPAGAVATVKAPITGPKRPTSGAYLGVYSDLPGLTAGQSVSSREKQLGRKFAIDSHYYNWTDNFPGAAEKADATTGRTPMITWWGTTLSDITDGSSDALIRARASSIKSFGKPVFLRWGAEMNGNWFAWSGPSNGNNPAAYVAAWKHIHDIFASAGVTNVSWVWAPNANSKPGGTDVTSWNNWRNYYPGDAYVDWVGADGYNWGSFALNRWRSMASFMGAIYRDYAGHKPFMILETATNAFGGDKGAWLDQTRAWIEAHTAFRTRAMAPKVRGAWRRASSWPLAGASSTTRS